jgi:hypothetical protein
MEAGSAAHIVRRTARFDDPVEGRRIVASIAGRGRWCKTCDDLSCSSVRLPSARRVRHDAQQDTEIGFAVQHGSQDSHE